MQREQGRLALISSERQATEAPRAAGRPDAAFLCGIILSTWGGTRSRRRGEYAMWDVAAVELERGALLVCV
eukprot:3634593-Prymnesium_polylepis.1